MAYAFFHNLNISRFLTLGEPPILTDRLPVPQLISGLFLWRNFREHERENNQGYLHATITHAVSNLTTYAIYKAGQFASGKSS